MIEVVINLHSAVDGRSERLARMTITNDGTLSDGSGDSEYGRYDVVLQVEGEETKRGWIGRFRRDRRVMALVGEALKAVGK